jgi:hypothetical protein
LSVPEEIQDLCADFLDGLSAVLGQKLFGVYLLGGWAFPEGTARGDVDLHVIVEEPLNEQEKSAVVELHSSMASEYPSLVGEGLDAWYFLLDDARATTPPTHQLETEVIDKSWALHRAHIHGGHCIVLRGPDPRELYPQAPWEEVADALQGELRFVAEHLGDHPAYCVLNLCRLMYSHQTRDVVTSKYRSALWARDALPEKRPCIDAAMKSYEGTATAAEIHLVKTQATGFFDFACARIRQNCGGSAAAQSADGALDGRQDLR